MASSKSTATAIIKKTRAATRRLNWLTRLSSEKQRVIRDVVKMLVVMPDISVKSVSRTLIEDLELPVGEETTARTLLRLIQDEQKSE